MANRLIRVGLLAVVLILVFWGYRRFFAQHEPPGELHASGTIEITEIRLSFQAPGRIATLRTVEGAHVKPGDVLATLESAELDLNVARGREAVAALAARVRALEHGARPAEIAQAEAALTAAESQVTLAKQNLERVKPLAASGAVSPSQLDQAQGAADLAVAQADRARETLRLLREGARPEELQAARAQRREAQAALDLAQSRVAYGVITAPVEGIVLVKAAEPGEVVNAGMPVLILGKLAAPWMNVYISEARIGRVSLGQKAAVRIDSFPDRRYPARVSYIASEAEFTPKNVQTQEERVKLVFKVRLDVENPDLSLKPGMPADAVIFTGEPATRNE